MQTNRAGTTYDVVIIGSGAGGGTMVQVLTSLGIKVAVLEAGPMINPAKDYKEHAWAWQVPHRGAADDGAYYFGRSPWAFNYFYASFGGWQLEGEPYTTVPGNDFRWFRSRALGGRTNHYGRFSFRFSDYDFKPYDRDGLGDNWPISYDEVAPYYDKAESFIGITGTKENIRSTPDGIFQEPPPPRVHELLVQRASKKLNIPCIPNRMAVITRNHNGRAACHYCGQCGRGCVTASNYCSANVQILPAMRKTPNLVTMFPNSMARELLTDASGKVTAVSYIDTATRTEKQIRCRTVVLAASACESARLLLNSKSSRHPNGLANSSGVVGKYLTDTVGFAMSAAVPALRNLPRHDSDGMGGMHVFMPWWLWDKQQQLGFPRGYHIEVGGGFGMPGVGSFHGACRRLEGYGAKLKEQIREEYGSTVGLSGRGEMIPNKDSYCEIDPNVVDKYGIPVLRFAFKWTDYELKQMVHMEQTFAEILTTLGATVIKSPRTPQEKISIGGEIIHELGTIRMGDDPAKSALNKYCQSHEVKNLFVADAAPFVSNPDKNPTLTICALAWRTAEYMAEEMRKGNV